jgi:hypothetical protein
MGWKAKTILTIFFCTLYPFVVESSDGYRSLINYEDGFLAVGSGGRMDWITASGHLEKSMELGTENLHVLIPCNRDVYAAGDSGALFVLSEGTVEKIELGTNQSILSLTYFNDKLLAGSLDGVLFVGDQNGAFHQLQLPVTGDIVSLSSRKLECFGVTNRGEILRSTDGVTWNIFDFNAYYAGFYKPCQFTCILADNDQIAIAGMNNDGAPILMLSAQGSVWSERNLTYSDDHGAVSTLKNTPIALFRDRSADELLLVCQNGVILIAPSCSHCNRMVNLSAETFKCIALNGKTWLSVGDYFQRSVLEVGWK